MISIDLILFKPSRVLRDGQPTSEHLPLDKRVLVSERQPHLDRGPGVDRPDNGPLEAAPGHPLGHRDLDQAAEQLHRQGVWDLGH